MAKYPSRSMGGEKQVQKVKLPFTDEEKRMLRKLVQFQKRKVNEGLADELRAAGHVQRPVSSLRRKAKAEKWIK